MEASASPVPFPMKRETPLNPPPELTRRQLEEPVSRVAIWNGSNPWLVTRYEDVRAVLTDDRFSAEVGRPGFPSFSPGAGATSIGATTFFTMDPPEHDRYRRMLTSEFSVKRVNAMRPRLQTTADELLAGFTGMASPADLVEHYAMPFPSLAICQLLGVPYEDHELFQSCSRCIMTRTAAHEEVIEAGNRLGRYMRELVATKESDPGDDLISRLIEEQVRPGNLSHDELVDIARLLLFAGHETTANMVSMAVLVLLLHPDQLEILRAEPELINKAIEECLRYVTINHLGRRRVAKVDVDFRGHLIKAGDGIIAAGDVANRDSTHFEDPDVFDIRQGVAHHVSFGFGIHQCLGQNLARAELQIAVGTLVRQLPGLRLAVPITDLQFKDEAIAYGVETLPVTW